jgi:hypothetical protein
VSAQSTRDAGAFRGTGHDLLQPLLHQRHGRVGLLRPHDKRQPGTAEDERHAQEANAGAPPCLAGHDVWHGGDQADTDGEKAELDDKLPERLP